MCSTRHSDKKFTSNASPNRNRIPSIIGCTERTLSKAERTNRSPWKMCLKLLCGWSCDQWIPQTWGHTNVLRKILLVKRRGPCISIVRSWLMKLIWWFLCNRRKFCNIFSTDKSKAPDIQTYQPASQIGNTNSRSEGMNFRQYWAGDKGIFSIAGDFSSPTKYSPSFGHDWPRSATIRLTDSC